MKEKVGFCTILIVICIVFLIYSDNNHKDEITKQIHAINGEVVSIDTLGLFEHDPLPLGGKGTTKYKFTYKQKGQTQTGYVMFAWSDTWIMNDKDVK